jgi:hypothetical protein
MDSTGLDGFIFHCWKGEKAGGAKSESATVHDAIDCIHNTIEIFKLVPKDVVSNELYHNQMCRLQDSRN